MLATFGIALYNRLVSKNNIYEQREVTEKRLRANWAYWGIVLGCSVATNSARLQPKTSN